MRRTSIYRRFQHKTVNSHNMITVKLYVSLLLHLIGDYILQTEYMAQNKTKSNWVALIHAITYSLPFPFICPSKYWLIIVVSHYFIDRYRLPVYLIRLKNMVKWKIPSGENYGFNPNTPPWLSTWLMIIIDNTIHLIINSIAIYLHEYH